MLLLVIKIVPLCPLAPLYNLPLSNNVFDTGMYQVLVLGMSFDKK